MDRIKKEEVEEDFLELCWLKIKPRKKYKVKISIYRKRMMINKIISKKRKNNKNNKFNRSKQGKQVM